MAVSRDYKFMCSSLGQELIEKDIQELGLTRVVVAACSPHLHETTFRNACQRAGLNPFLFEMASIREQVSWVTKDKEVATEKAKALIGGRSDGWSISEPLEPIVVDINPNVLVVGGGIAGIQAALEIADSGHHVYLVEREPSIGGHMAQFDKTFPTLDCSACILTPKMFSAGTAPEHHPAHLERGGEGGRLHRQLHRQDPQEGAQGEYRAVHRLRHLRAEVPQEGRRQGLRGRHGLSQSDLHAVPPGRAEVPGDRRRELHLLPAGQVQGVPEILPDRRDRLRSAGRVPDGEGRQHHPGDGLRPVRLPAGFPSTATAGWPTSSPAWNSSGCPTRPGPPAARSCCRTARPRRRAWPSSIAWAAGTSTTTRSARRSAACSR